MYLLADNKTKRHFQDRHEAIDDDSEAYCWRRNGFFWRMRASFGLACAQATTPLRSLLSFFVFLYLSVCEALKLRSLPFTHPIYVASRYFQ